MMELLDSDIFILDLRFPEDVRHPVNRRFLKASGFERATTIFNLLEVCGILSFNLSREALLTLYAEFGRRYSLSVLFPPAVPLSALIAGTFEKITRKMTYGDAQILWTAEQHPVIDRVITWNTRDFAGRTSLAVMTPRERLVEMGIAVP